MQRTVSSVSSIIANGMLKSTKTKIKSFICSLIGYLLIAIVNVLYPEMGMLRFILLVAGAFIIDWFLRYYVLHSCKECKKLNNIDLFLKILYQKILSKQDEQIRCSYLVPVNDHYLERISCYDWNNTYNHNSKRIRAGTGTAGKAFTTGNEIILPEIEGDFKEVMKRDWGFTQKEVDNLNQSRRSYVSKPFLNSSKKVIGILCVDSSISYFATEERLNEMDWFVQNFCDFLK